MTFFLTTGVVLPVFEAYSDGQDSTYVRCIAHATILIQLCEYSNVWSAGHMHAYLNGKAFHNSIFRHPSWFHKVGSRKLNSLPLVNVVYMFRAICGLGMRCAI